MFTMIMVLVIGAMTHGLSAMEELKPKQKFTTLELLKKSPNTSNNSSPNLSPRSAKEVIKISSRKSIKGDLKTSCYEFMEKELWKAVKENDQEKALDIIHPNMDIVDQSGKSLLILAIKNKSEWIVKALLTHKNIDVNLADKNKNTPLHHALLACNEAIITMLLSDYRVNSELKGNGDISVEQLTDNEFYLNKNELKRMIFFRKILDNMVNEKALSSSLNIQNNGFSMDDALCDIKKIPQLPQYVTDDFIKNMILYRMNELRLKNKS